MEDRSFPTSITDEVKTIEDAGDFLAQNPRIEEELCEKIAQQPSQVTAVYEFFLGNSVENFKKLSYEQRVSVAGSAVMFYYHCIGIVVQEKYTVYDLFGAVILALIFYHYAVSAEKSVGE